MLFAVLAGFVLTALAPLLHRYLPRQTGALTALLPAGLFFWFLGQAELATGAGLSEHWPWAPQFGVDLAFRLDGLSLLMALIICGIGTLIFVYAGSYLHGDPQQGRMLAILPAFMAAMLGLVLADNLILLFIFWELTSITSFLLIGYRHEEAGARRAAQQALVITAGGGLAMLAGFLLLGSIAGGFEIAALAAHGERIQTDARYLLLLLLIASGALTKSAQFPFHFWLPGAMVAPTPVSAYLHSATMVKAGVYLLARLAPALGGSAEWETLFTPIGVLTMLVGALLSLCQTDLKRILAWSTVSSLGALVSLLAQGGKLAAEAAALFLLVHALYKGALFMVAGALDHATGTRDIRRLRGLARSMPLLALATALAALSMSGIPLFLGFVGKELIYETSLEVSTLLSLAFLLANSTFVAVALLLALRPFAGKLPQDLRSHRPGTGLWLGPLLLASLGLALGLWPAGVARLIGPAAGAIYGQPLELGLFILPPEINPVLLLSVLTIIAGTLVWGFRARLAPALEVLDIGPRMGPERVYTRAMAALPGLSGAFVSRLQHGRLRDYLFTVVATLLLLLAATWTLNGGLPLPEDLDVRLADLQFHELSLLLVILAGLGSTLLARRLLVMIVSLGATGFGIALLFLLYGAPDLAMTQFSIETLGVILFMLVLWRLPGLQQLSPPRLRLRDGLVSLLAGAMMTMLLLTITGQPLFSPLKKFFAEASYPLAHGHNIVNVILVDFRGLDTLGEITVLGIAAIAIHALLKLRPERDSDRESPPRGKPRA